MMERHNRIFDRLFTLTCPTVSGDEGGCHLRSVLYNGESLCLPGNLVEMLTIVQKTGETWH